MHFALVNNERIAAAPDLKGLCPGCAQPVIAKCGKQRIWHWAHRTERVCDQWWESETEWHRNWKQHFPLEWQEFIQHDARSGEKHIADVRTSQNLVLEFQHSPLKPEERAARESFYGNMVWVVNGTRLPTVYKRFRKAADKFINIAQGWYFVDYPDECFPPAWLDSTALVFFDFREAMPANPPDPVREPLWVLLPKRAGRYAVVTALPREAFIKEASASPQLFEGHGALIDEMAQSIQRRNANLYPQPFIRSTAPRRRRRF